MRFVFEQVFGLNPEGRLGIEDFVIRTGELEMDMGGRSKGSFILGHCLHFGADEHPCTTYFDVYRGYRVLTHSHMG